MACHRINGVGYFFSWCYSRSHLTCDWYLLRVVRLYFHLYGPNSFAMLDDQHARVFRRTSNLYLEQRGREAKRSSPTPSVTGVHSTIVYMTLTPINSQNSTAVSCSSRAAVLVPKIIATRYPRRSCELKLVLRPLSQTSTRVID